MKDFIIAVAVFFLNLNKINVAEAPSTTQSSSTKDAGTSEHFKGEHLITSKSLFFLSKHDH